MSYYDKTVAKYFGMEVKSGKFGIEVECEATNNLPAEVQGWRTAMDGSLRGSSIEYVLSRPMNLHAASTAVNTLDKRIREYNTSLVDSCRAGVHIHINVGSWAIRELFTFFCVYYIFEEVLVDLCGEGRQGNLFCLRAKDAEFVITTMETSTTNLSGLTGDYLRYSALNPNAMPRHGSIEFRAIRTPIDIRQLTWWLEVFDYFTNAVLTTFKTPVDPIEQLSLGGEELLLDVCFGEHAEKLRKVKDYNQKMRKGVRMAQDIAYSVTDWN